jgi:CheY-like chemotaxis protein
MNKRVLLVDDDQEMLLSLREGLEKYRDTFSVVTAGDGLAAKAVLKDNNISLTVSDLKMPQMDGFALLSHIMEAYPHVPVIIITAYSTPRMEQLAKDGGAVGYIEKPFMVEELAKKILTTLRKESEGGTLHGISSGMFLQLIEMEQKSCTIRLFNQVSGKQGVLFFKDGELFDARINGLKGEQAAYEIFSWDKVTLSIQNECLQKEKKIESELQAILLEAMRLKDEAGQSKGPNGVVNVPVEDSNRGGEKLEEEDSGLVNKIEAKLVSYLGKRGGVNKVYLDTSWDHLLDYMKRIGNMLEAGQLRLSFLAMGNADDLILLPGEQTAVVSLHSNSPRERIIQLLGG